LPIADDPVVELSTFTLAGSRMASLRHSVTSAERSGLRVVPYEPSLARGVTAVSRSWLSSKRGGEMGFTLGRFDIGSLNADNCRVVLDRTGNVVEFCTWLAFDDGRARVLDIMRRLPDAPNPTMDLLLARSLLEFASQGVERASLACVPRFPKAMDFAYPAGSLRRYKDKFNPTWETRWLIVPRYVRLASALRAVALAYCPDGLVGELRRNLGQALEARRARSWWRGGREALDRIGASVPRARPVVTALSLGAVAATAVRYHVFTHGLPLMAAFRYGFSGRALLNGNWGRLVTSELLTRDTFMVVSMMLSLAVMLGLYETIAGSARAALIAVVAGLAAPAVVGAALGLGSALGFGFAGRTLSTMDYGASAVTAGAGGALIASLGWAGLRRAAVVFVVGGLLLHHQLADWEHLVAFPVGYALSRWLFPVPAGARRPADLGKVAPTRDKAAPRPSAPAIGLRVAAVLAAVTGGVVFAARLVKPAETIPMVSAPVSHTGSLTRVELSPARIVEATYPTPSLGRSAKRRVLVYLPAGYDNNRQRYPVVEMLHGDPGQPEDMIGLLNLNNPTEMPARGAFIAVAPDGHGPRVSEGSFADTPRQLLGQAVSRDLQSWIDTDYRTTGQWTIMGLSEGGFGAAYLGFHDPNTYRGVCAVSGYFQAEGPAFARQPQSVRLASSPIDNASRGGPPTLLVVGSSHRYFLNESLRYSAALAAADQPYQLIVERGGHDWTLWHRATTTCLSFLLNPIVLDDQR
jgi:S-formylglutathione hydrolase FrmB